MSDLKAIFDNALIGVPVYQGMAYGGAVSYSSTTDFVKADYPGLRGIRIDGVFTLAADLAETVSIVPKNFGRGLGVLGRVQRTDLTPMTASGDIANLSVAVVVEANRLIKITGQGDSNLTSTGRWIFHIQEGSTVLGRFGDTHWQTGTDVLVHGFVTVVAPSAGAHTYKLVAQEVAGSSTLNFYGDATSPSFILVEDIGSSAKVAEVELWY